MKELPNLPTPLFFTVVSQNSPGTTMFVNAAHVMKIEIEAATRQHGSITLSDGSSIELGANEADWIMRLMAAHDHQQMIILSELKNMSGG